jgi:hypothetical protein
MDGFLISWIVCLNILLGTCLADSSNFYGIPNLKVPSARHLSPATVASTLHRRSDGSKLLKRETNFDFVDVARDSARSFDSSVFTASVLVRSRMPILALEDLESDLMHVSCSDSTIEFSFTSLERLEDACKEFERISTFVVVTSHFGCNENDQRAPHL